MSRARISTPAPLSRANILIVDDQRAGLQAIEAILTGRGLDIVTASSGFEALRCCLDRDFALVLLDVRMPGMDGFETAKAIRERERSRETPIIFLTADQNADMQVMQGYAIGAVDYLLKPVLAEILRAKVVVFVDLWRQREQIRRQSLRLLEMEAREHERELREATEAERRRADEEIRKLAERQALILDSVPMVLYTCRPSGAFGATWISDNAGRVTGFPPSAFVESPDFWLSRVHPEDRAGALADAATVFEKGAHAYEYRWQVADGSYRWFLDQCVVVPDADGNPLERVGTWLDVHGRKVIEEELRQLNAELEDRVTERTADLAAANEQLAAAKGEAERANKAKSEFLSRMSHELRTPLNAVLGFAQVLAMDPLSSDQGESVQEILKAGRHLLDLINEVLDISRIESGKLAISPEPVLMAEVVQEATDLIRGLADQRGVRISQPECELLRQHVIADRQRLLQVLLNVLSNAVKYNVHGGAVTITCEEGPSGWTRVRFADTGPGIPPDKLERLFTPFDRLGAEAGEVEGTGLGLSLSKHLVEAMGGRIGVESAVGSGTTVWLELAREEGPVAGHERRLAAGLPPGEESAEGLPAATVLYVEDNLSNLRLLQRVFARRGDIRLLSAMQGSLALDIARQERPALVLLDLHLPDMPGSELLARLRAEPETREIPVVVISADATPGTVERLLAAGAREYLTKPLDVERFLDVVKRVLGSAE